MLEMMQGLQGQMQSMQKNMEGMQGGGSSSKKKAMYADDDADDDDVKTLALYKRAREQIMGALHAGAAPTPEHYAERDLHMYRLADDDLQAEYEGYTQMYLDDATSAPVRGMAEMTLIKLGEIVDKPQHRRIKSARRPRARPLQRSRSPLRVA